MRRERRPRGTDGRTRRRARLHAHPPREGAQIPPTPRIRGGFVRHSPLGGTDRKHPPDSTGVSVFLSRPRRSHIRVFTRILARESRRPLPPVRTPLDDAPHSGMADHEPGDLIRAYRHGSAAERASRTRARASAAERARDRLAAGTVEAQRPALCSYPEWGAPRAPPPCPPARRAAAVK